MAFFQFKDQYIAYQLNESDKQGSVDKGDEAETLVFLHGLGADRRQSEQSVSGLSYRRILTLDMPGHGQTIINSSENIKHWFSFETFSDIVLALLDHLGIQRAIFGGISMGAGISIQAALKKPECVAGLILVRPAWLDSAAVPNLLVVKNIGEDLQYAGFQRAREHLLSQLWFQKLEFDNPASAQSIKGLFTRAQAISAAPVLNNLVNDAPFKHVSQLKQIKQPTIVFGNEEDPLHPTRIAEKIADVIPNAGYQKLPSRYHRPKEHQRQLTQLIHEFLSADSSQCRKLELGTV
ncbi:alpha/beta fold hydrolase [Paraglaciecola sp.]|uniref:alpha/beta fold hydrolase n=1 Tax=Paraglaciecola sp. TaxID=1920173 RepID=UPI003EF61B92